MGIVKSQSSEEPTLRFYVQKGNEGDLLYCALLHI